MADRVWRVLCRCVLGSIRCWGLAGACKEGIEITFCLYWQYQYVIFWVVDRLALGSWLFLHLLTVSTAFRIDAKQGASPGTAAEI